MVLGKSIYLSNGKLLLGAGFRFTGKIKSRLSEMGYSHVYIMEEGTDDVVPEDIISDEIKMQAKSKLYDKLAEIKRLAEFQNLTAGKAIKLLERGYLQKVNLTFDLRNVIQEILKDISSAGVTILNSVMIKTKDTYFLDHALNVTVLAILIGRKYRYSHRELVQLGLGCFLHDIGKVIIDQIAGSDTKKADELYREHPTFGYLILRDNADVSPIETQIVNQHHEHQDGSGFPIGLLGQNLPPVKTVVRDTSRSIFRMAEICCVADAFDKLAYSPLTPGCSPADAAHRLILDSGTVYNKEIMQTLLKVAPFYPVGVSICVVDIVDPHLIGYHGVVAKINEDNINRPVIILTRNKFMKKVTPIVVDTSKYTHVELKLVL